MNPKLIAIHAGCIALAAVCVFISTIPQVQALPMAGQTLVASAFWLWGKSGFKPSQALLQQILQSMTPAEVAKLTNPPPPLPSSDKTTPSV